MLTLFTNKGWYTVTVIKYYISLINLLQFATIFNCGHSTINFNKGLLWQFYDAEWSLAASFLATYQSTTWVRWCWQLWTHWQCGQWPRPESYWKCITSLSNTAAFQLNWVIWLLLLNIIRLCVYMWACVWPVIFRVKVCLIN